jgi:hypothetical protein
MSVNNVRVTGIGSSGEGRWIQDLWPTLPVVDLQQRLMADRFAEFLYKWKQTRMSQSTYSCKQSKLRGLRWLALCRSVLDPEGSAA